MLKPVLCQAGQGLGLPEGPVLCAWWVASVGAPVAYGALPVSTVDASAALSLLASMIPRAISP